MIIFIGFTFLIAHAFRSKILDYFINYVEYLNVFYKIIYKIIKVCILEEDDLLKEVQSILESNFIYKHAVLEGNL